MLQEDADEKIETPYGRLKQAAHEYGEAAMENFLRCRAFGLAFVDGFPAFLKCDPSIVSLVPAKGPFDPTKPYGDRAFSVDPARVIRLEPVTFGVCIIIPHTEDSGSLWLRTGIRLEVTGDTFDIFVSNQPMVRVPLDFEGNMDAVNHAVLTEFLSVFNSDIGRFKDQAYADGIGFVPDRQNSDFEARPVTKERP